MDALLTWALTGLVLAYLVWGFRRPETIYEFPFLAAAMTMAFILPQLPALVDNTSLPPGGYAKTIAFTILCLAGLGLGWRLPAAQFKFLQPVFSAERLVVVAGLLALVGAAFYYQVSQLPGDVTVGVPIAGVQVVYLFFARFLPYGLAIAVLCFARKPSLLAAAIIAFCLVFYLDRIVVTGKRAETMELAMIFALAFWFQRRWVVPRPVTLVAIVFATVALISMTQYRDVTRANSGPVWEEIGRIDLVSNFEILLENGGDEVRNAVARITYADETQQFDFGAFHWNRIIAEYVPSQVLGASFKNSLMLPMPALNRNYSPLTGSTETGMSDAFQSFWFFGALKYVLLAFLMRRLWNTAMAGHAAAQIVFTLSIVPAIHSISHVTDWVMTVWVHMSIFLFPALALAWVRLPTGLAGFKRLLAVSP